jgi:hypothetical protein
MAPTDAKRRHGATNSAEKPQKEIASAKKRQSASPRAFVAATVATGVRAPCSKKSFLVRATFGGAKPITLVQAQ